LYRLQFFVSVIFYWPNFYLPLFLIFRCLLDLFLFEFD
jgi:hypothetical protein